MGAVYLGEQTVIGSKVAIKVLHEHLASNASLVQRFYDDLLAVTGHPRRRLLQQGQRLGRLV